MTVRPTGDSAPRDPRFDAAWRATSNEEPPAALDAAILAAARREVGAKPQSLSAHAATQRRRRWWPLAAAATVAVIAIGVVQRAGHDELVAPPSGGAIVSDMPAKSVAESPQRGAQPTPSEPRADAASNAGGGAAEGRVSADSAAVPQAARGAPPAARADASRRSAPVAAPPPEKKSESVATAAAPLPEPFPAGTPKLDADAMRESATAAAPPMPMPPAASFAEGTRVSGPSAVRSSSVAKTATAGAAEEVRSKDRAPLPVADWITLIRRLRDEGKTVEAARELAAFRTAHTDYERLLPPDLRDWHPSEK